MRVSTPAPADGSGGVALSLRPPPPLLPFGPSLHYTGCGCPYTWAPGCRLADWGDSYVHGAVARCLAEEAGGPARLAPIRPLKVAYCLPHANVTGGMKQLLEQMRLLRQRGHHVVALTRSEVAATAVPPWSDVQVDEDVVCGPGQRFRDVYDVDTCDAVVLGMFHHIPEWLTSTSVPLLYFEQGHEWLFGDPVRFQEEGGASAQDQLFHEALHLPVCIAAVSECVQSIVLQEFGRSCLLVHNGVDCERFRPGPPDAAALAAPTAVLGGRADTLPPCGCGGQGGLGSLCAGGRGAGGSAEAQQQRPQQQDARQAPQQQAPQEQTPQQQVAQQQLPLQQQQQPLPPLPPPPQQQAQQQQAQQQSPQQRPSVLLVGNPGLGLKGFDCALATLARVNRSCPIQVHWICQQAPSPKVAAAIAASGLCISLHVDPPQGALPALYRGHQCFLFTSRFEAFGMPVLEAMASGLPVVATETAGVCSFATHELDCLLAPPGDAAELAAAVLRLLRDGALSARLAASARQTALAYSPERTGDELERALYALAACRQELLALRLQALPDAQRAAATAVRACAGAAAQQRADHQARQAAATSQGQKQQCSLSMALSTASLPSSASDQTISSFLA